jgi:hypothetical protein
VLTLPAPLLHAQAPPESGRVTVAVGEVNFAPPGTTNFEPVSRGAILPVGSTVTTGSGSRAIVVAGPGQAIRIGPESTVKLTALAFARDQQGATSDRVMVEINDGTVSALIDRAQTPDADFQIRTPHGVAAARGTIYAVHVDDEDSYALVDRGRVALILGEN